MVLHMERLVSFTLFPINRGKVVHSVHRWYPLALVSRRHLNWWPFGDIWTRSGPLRDSPAERCICRIVPLCNPVYRVERQVS